MASELERVLDKLDELSGGLADLRVAVGKLEARLDASAPPSKPGLVRDSGLAGAGGAFGAALAALFNHFAR